MKGDDARYDSSESLSDISLVTRTAIRTMYQLKALNTSCASRGRATPHFVYISLKYMQVLIDAMRVAAQETEIRPNIKTQEEEIENDSSRDQDAAPTPDTQNQSMHSHPPIVLFTFIRRVLSGKLCVSI